MIQIIAEAKIEEYGKFIAVFTTKGKELRAKHGSTRCVVFRNPADPNLIHLVFDWESKEKFEGFFADPLTRETMKESGTIAPPKFTIVERIGELPA